ncbi:MAG: hypothetical protein VCA35_05725, partial [Roseibacillus sp.]
MPNVRIPALSKENGEDGHGGFSPVNESGPGSIADCGAVAGEQVGEINRFQVLPIDLKPPGIIHFGRSLAP